MAKHTKAEIAEARAELLKILRKGDTVTAICRNHSRSGTTRWDFYLLPTKGKRAGGRWYLNHNIAVLLGERRSADGTIVIPYLNMDPAFHTVYSLAGALWPSRRVPCKACRRTGRVQGRIQNPYRFNEEGHDVDPTKPYWVAAEVECRACSGTGTAYKNGGYCLKSERM